MTLTQAINKAADAAALLRRAAIAPDVRKDETATIAMFLEHSKAIEHVCAVARQHLRPPGRRGKLNSN